MITPPKLLSLIQKPTYKLPIAVTTNTLLVHAEHCFLGHFEISHFSLRDCRTWVRSDTVLLYIRCFEDIRIQYQRLTLYPEATVTTIWKTAICKGGILKCPVSHVVNFRSWIKIIYDKITLIYCVENEFNPNL